VIYFLRHGDAEHETSNDADRRLTEKGERQAEAAGRALAEMKAEIDDCLSSPKVRAQQTAKLACEHLNVAVETTDELRGGPFDARQLAAGRGNVLLVGHEPDFSNAIADLTGGRVMLRKGGVVCVDEGLLHALLRPKELRRIAGI
jgi:phosphohistidine phosphatase